MALTTLPKDSAEYARVVSEIFAEVIRRSPLGPAASEAGVTPSLMQALEYIYLHGPSPIRKLASGLSISVPGASQLADRLVHKGLAARRETEADRRLAEVELTPAGQRIVSEARSERIAWMSRVLSEMRPERRLAFVEILEEFIRIALSAEEDIESACVRCGIEHLAFCVVNRAHLEVTGEQITEY